MDRFVDSWYVVTGVVTVRKRDRPTLIVSLQVFCLVLLNVICGHVCRICAKGRNGQSALCFVIYLSSMNKAVFSCKLALLK